METHIDVLRVMSSLSSIAMMLSLVPTVYQIKKKRKTGHTTITPMVAMLVNYHLWMMYGFLVQDYFPVFATFVIGDLVALCYISIYYYWTTEHAVANKLLAAAAAFLAVVTTYTVLGYCGYTGQSRDQVASIIGYVGIATVVALYTSPFEAFGRVLKYKSGVFIPIHMVSAGAINNGIWVVYSALTQDWFILAPNIFVFCMGVAQVVVYFFFHPSKNPLPEDAASPKVHQEQVKDLESGHVGALSPTNACDQQKPNGSTPGPHYVPVRSPLALLHV